MVWCVLVLLDSVGLLGGFLCSVVLVGCGGVWCWCGFCLVLFIVCV